MHLQEIVYKRKSVRSYTGKPLKQETLENIKAFVKELKPLYSDIKVHSEIVTREQVKCILPWTTPQLIAIFSEDKDGYLENVGFMFQQLDLYLQSIGIGVCWLGMGKLSEQKIFETKEYDKMRYVIMLAFGEPKGDSLRNNISEFKRKKLSEISDEVDERLEPARLAPSSINSQPWYFVHEDNIIHAYCELKGLLSSKFLGDMNLIDMGIALAHIYVSNEETFKFFKVEHVGKVKGYEYIGSFKIN